MKQEGLICVSIGTSRLADALALVESETEVADLFEIRLDHLDEIDIPAFFSATDRQLLFTNRPDWEGGEWDGPEEKRIDLLCQAAFEGAAYIDCELRAPQSSRARARQTCRESGARLIYSWHDFNLTPPQDELAGIVEQMQQQGADIGKLITTAHDHLDVLRVLGLQEQAARLDFPLTAFCMGGAGRVSRLATLELGGYMSYCSPTDGENTAPGQLDGQELRSMRNRLR